MQLANQILFIEKSWWWANFSQIITFIIDKNVFLLPGTTVTASSSSFTERSSAIIVVSFENTLISSFFSNKLSLSFDYDIPFNGSAGQHSNSVITLPVLHFLQQTAFAFDLTITISLRIHWRLLRILETSRKVYDIMIFSFEKVWIFWKCIHYNLHWDKSQ